jgi:hypothetical protein
VVTAWRAGMGKREGAPGAAWDSAAAQPRRAWAARRGTSRGWPNRGGAEGLTGGPQPQCQAAAPTDRQDRVA